MVRIGWMVRGIELELGLRAAGCPRKETLAEFLRGGGNGEQQSQQCRRTAPEFEGALDPGAAIRKDLDLLFFDGSVVARA